MNSNQVLELSAQLSGRAVLPGDDDYDSARTGWNLSVEHHPAVVVAAEEPADVVAAVRFAAEADLPIAVEATGHGASVPADGAVYINTGGLNELMIDARSRTARIGAGLRWGQVVQAAAEHGLAPLCGSSAHVGVMGYLTGGGLPVLGRTFGFAAETVRSLDLVTADGQLRTVSPSSEADLYWAVRGARSNFGVVVAAEIDLLPILRLYGGHFSFDGQHAEQVLRTYVDWAHQQPEEMTSSIILVRFPDIPQMADDVRGRFLVNVRIAYVGAPADGERLVAPLRALRPEQDHVRDMPYTEISEIYRDPFRPTPARVRTALLHDLDDKAVDDLIAVAGPEHELPFGGIELRHLGGALSRKPARPSAVGAREAQFHLFMSMPAPIASNSLDMVHRTQEKVLASLHPWDTGSQLPGLMFNHETHPEDVRRGYPEADYRRLVQLKTNYDPRNLFRLNHNIPPW